LPQSEYFIVKNVHTRFTLINNANQVKVNVEDGQVEVIGEKIDETVEQGKQLAIDERM